MVKKDIENIGLFIEKHNMVALEEIYKTFENKNSSSFDDICYAIMNKIEKSSELMDYFKKISKEQKGVKELIPYCIRIENIRFFIDNRDEYELTDTFIDKMKNNFDKRYYTKIETINKKQKENLKKITIPSMILCIIIAVVSTIIILKPFFVTHIIKKATITEAKVIEQKIIPSLRFPNQIYFRYKYNVNGEEYIKDGEFLGYRLKYEESTDSTIKIYYYIEEPSKSYLYLSDYLRNILIVVFDLLIIIATIKAIKQYKLEKRELYF